MATPSLNSTERSLKHGKAKRSVLVVDDSADALEILKIILETDDYYTFTAQGGGEAFALLQKIDPPDLILLDIQMAEMDGPEFVQLLEKKRPDILRKVPIVFLTGQLEVPKSKATGLIRKPFDNGQLLRAARRFIAVGARNNDLATQVNGVSKAKAQNGAGR